MTNLPTRPLTSSGQRARATVALDIAAGDDVDLLKAAVVIDVLDAAVAAILRTVGLPDTEARAVCAVLWAGPTDPPTPHRIEPRAVEGHHDDPQTDR